VQIARTINATGNVNIGSTASSTATFTANGLYFTYAESDATATAQILQYGAVNTPGSFTLAANATNNLTNTSKAVAGHTDSNGNTEQGPAVAVTYSKANSTSVAGAESGATVSAGSVDVQAINNNSFDTEASPTETTGSGSSEVFGAGVAVVISDTSSSADAHLNGTVTATGPITSDAESTNSKNEVSAEAEVSSSSSSDDSSGNTGQITGFTDGAEQADSSQTTTQTGDSREDLGNSLALGAAVAIVNSTNKASSTAGPNAAIDANGINQTNASGQTANTGTVSITASASDTFKADASGSADGSTLDLSGAVAVANYSNAATAAVSAGQGGQQGSGVNATGGLTVSATANLPEPAAAVLESIQDYIDSITLTGAESTLSDYVTDATSDNNGLNGIENLAAAFLKIKSDYDTAKDETTSSLSGKSGGSGSGAVVTGVVNILTANDTATAYVDQGAKVSAQSANVAATATVQSVNTAGTSAAEEASDSAPDEGSGQGGGGGSGSGSGSSTAVGVGGTYAGITYNNTATAYIAPGATVTTTSGDVDVLATANNFMANYFSSEATGENTIGISGAISNIDLNSTSTAYISSGATVKSAGNIDVDAENSNYVYQLGYDNGTGSNVGVGIVLGFLNVKDTTDAYIGDTTSLPSPAGGSVSAAGSLTVNANSYERLMAASASKASAGGNDSDEGDKNGTASGAEQNGESSTADTNENTEQGNYSFGIGASGDIAFNTVNDSTQAFINNGVAVNAGSTTVTATDKSLMVSADGGLVSGSTVGLQGSFDEDKVTKDTEAYTNNVTLDTGSLTIGATSSDIVLAAAASGAGGSSSGGSGGSGGLLTLAGSVNYLDIANTTKAYTDGTTVRGQDGSSPTGAVAIDANNQETTITVAGALAYGSNPLGIGVGLDLGFIDNTVIANVDSNSDIRSNSTVGVNAGDNENQLSIVADLAVQGSTLDVAASVSFQSLTKDVEASIDGKVNAAQGVTVEAGDDQPNSLGLPTLGLPSGLIAVSGSLAIPSGEAGLGAAASSETDKTVEASIGAGANVTSNGDVDVTANTGETPHLFAGGFAWGEDAGFMGSAVVDLINDTTSATIGSPTADGKPTNVSANNVNVAANDSLNVIDGAGGLSVSENVAGTAGWDVEIYGLSTTATIGSRATVNAGSVDLSATQNENAISVAADGAVSAGSSTNVAVVGSGVVVTTNTDTSATSSGNVTTGGDFTVKADREDNIRTISGAGAVAINVDPENPTSAGMGIAVSVIDTTDGVTAAVNGGTDTVAGTLSVTATGNDTLNPLAVGFAVSDMVSLDASAAVNILNPTTTAQIGGATINPAGMGQSAQNVNVAANTSIDLPLSLAGAGVGSIFVGGGWGADVTTINNNTTAEIGSLNGPGTEVNSGGNILVNATSSEDANSLVVSAGTALVAVVGSTSVYDIGTTTSVTVYGGAKLQANDNVGVSALDTTDLNQLSGNVAIAGFGVALGVAVADVTKNTTAEVDGQITALGNGDPIAADNGSFDTPAWNFAANIGGKKDPYPGESASSDSLLSDLGSDASLITQQKAAPLTTNVNGLAVTSVSSNNFNSLEAGSGAGSGLALSNNTTADIANAAINPNGNIAGNPAGVYVTAASDVGHLGAAIGLSDSVVGLDPAVNVTSLNNTTEAYIAGSQIHATGDVEVTAKNTVDDLSVTLGGGDNAVTLAGSVGYTGVNDTTYAYVSGGNLGTTQAPVGNIAIAAEDDTTANILAGAGNLGIVGLAAAVGITHIAKDTEAHIDNGAGLSTATQPKDTRLLSAGFGFPVKLSADLVGRIDFGVPVRNNVGIPAVGIHFSVQSTFGLPRRWTGRAVK
jgi:hypothetical protein